MAEVKAVPVKIVNVQISFTLSHKEAFGDKKEILEDIISEAIKEHLEYPDFLKKVEVEVKAQTWGVDFVKE